MGRAGAIIVAAGKGTRSGSKDKVFFELDGQPLLARVIDTFQKCRVVDSIVVVLRSDSLSLGEKLAQVYSWPKVTAICRGGKRRQDSVMQGLKMLKNCQWVIVHDAARPLVTPDLIERGLAQATEIGAAIACVPVKDTIKIVSLNGIIDKTPDRSNLIAAQTPQIFRSDLIWEAHKKSNTEVNDDATMVENLGYEVQTFMGSYENIKITTPEDMALAEIIIKSRKQELEKTANSSAVKN